MRFLANILSVCAFGVLSSCAAAGYILPNGTILYDGNNDGDMYKIEKMTLEQRGSKRIEQAVEGEPNLTQSVIIEERRVVYDSPVYIRERVVKRVPMYDIVDVAGSVLVYGLIYDSARRSFYHHDLHRGKKPHKYRR